MWKTLTCTSSDSSVVFDVLGWLKRKHKKEISLETEGKVQGGWICVSGTDRVTVGVWLEQFLDHHMEAGSGEKFHVLHLSNAEAFHLPDLRCLLGHTGHSFKCSTSKEPSSAQDQGELCKGCSKWSNFLSLCTSVQMELGREALTTQPQFYKYPS